MNTGGGPNKRTQPLARAGGPTPSKPSHARPRDPQQTQPNAEVKSRTPFVSAEKMRILSATTAKLQRECKDPSVLLWIRSENAILFASETIEKQKL